MKDLLEQCDHKLMLGGLGVTACGMCEYLPHTMLSDKIPLPKHFLHGQSLQARCWSERYHAIASWNEPRSGIAETMTCVAGHWVNSRNRPVLDGFACGACVQVVRPQYAEFNLQDKQELYFASGIRLGVEVESRTTYVLAADATLKPQGANGGTFVAELGVGAS